MNRKLLSATIGVLILASSGLALADDWRDPHRFPQPYSEHGERWAQPDRHWPEYRDHDFHDRWHPGAYSYSRAAPYWGSQNRYERGWGHGYGDDGVTIILRNRDD
jgi:hypothetical protein